jgi:MFS family permease/uncharacterized membrane protein HdeD (DUF308 family)
MIQLLLLLLGANILRHYWWMPVALSALAFAAGVVFIGHLLHLPIIITTDVIGGLFILESVIRLLKLAAIGFPNATVPVLKALAFFFFGLLAIDVPWDDNIVATIVLGGVFIGDGLLRITSAVVIRSVRWRRLVIFGVANLIVGGLIWSPWPIQNRHTVPFCIGLALLPAAWSLLMLGLQLRRLRPGGSVTDLPIFATANWHGRGVVYPPIHVPENWEQAEPLTVHVWTPVGSTANPVRRPVVDRYIAAVDRNGMIATGHAALSVANDDYVSLYPADDVEYSPHEFSRTLRAIKENDVPGVFRPSFDTECAEWCAPDRQISFRRYNRAAVGRFVERYKDRPVYNLTNRNCSSSVALCLDVAMEGVLDQRRWWRAVFMLLADPAMWLLVLWRARAEAMTWTPGLLLDYADALQSVLSGRRQPWLVRLMLSFRRFQTRRRAEIKNTAPTQSPLPAVASLIATGMIFGLSYGLTSPLIALVLTKMGYGEGFIGANAAMHAVGVLLIAPVLPRLAWRIGPKLPMAASLLLAAAVLMTFATSVPVWLWFPLRLALGAASETMLVMSESWLNQLSGERHRTTTIAIYTAALSLGFALGPILLTVLGPDGPVPFILGAFISLLALFSIAMPWVRAPAFDPPEHRSIRPYLWLAPVALAATLVNAALETAGMSFLPLYAMRLGWAENSATMLLAVLLFGAIFLQLPIGWLGDRVNRNSLSIGLGFFSAAGALAWPFVIAIPYLAYPLLFVWGGAFVGIYTLMSAEVGSRFKGSNLVAVYVVMSLAWGCGALIGPSAAGVSMDVARHGLPYLVAGICALFSIFAIVVRKRGA